MNLPMAGFIVFFVVTLIFAYSWGWQNGHDARHGPHDDDPPNPSTPLWL